jgi:phosphoribosyl 1,2-cyclic phosphodiesterase
MSTHSDNSAALCVLSSSSGGNCSVLVLSCEGRRVLWLIDLGLSPRRTRVLLQQVGLADVPVGGVLLTHLDHDHMHQGWIGGLPDSWRVMLHGRHERRGRAMGLLTQPVDVYDDEFTLGARIGERSRTDVRVSPAVAAHDDLGSVAFRIATDVGDVGFVTDVGRPTQQLIDHLWGVEVLAVESNYCPQMQTASLRPAFLKDRITSGRGHLSNQQSARMVKAISPASDVVLLHLSRECNTPALAQQHHAHAGLRVTVASPQEPTPLVAVRRVQTRCRVPATLWG